MSTPRVHEDPLWPRAAHWLTPAEDALVQGDLAMLGVPAHLTSISPTGADATPAAVREALLRYSTYSTAHELDVATLTAFDLGDVPDPDGPEGETRVRDVVAEAAWRFRMLVAVGGDNSVTYSVLRGLAGESLGDWGLITVDAHHDLRDGVSNGSPIRRLVEAGLPGEHIVQLGITDFANSAAYVARAREYGITVIPREELRERSLDALVTQALETAGRGGRPVYVDLDVDVCDRSVAPGCPASAPGGISAHKLRRLAYLLCRDERVRGVDVAEVDATADAPDGRTVRLAALLVLEAAAGLASRG